LTELSNLAQAGCPPRTLEVACALIDATTALFLGLALLTAIDIHYFGEVPEREHVVILGAIKDHDAPARQTMHDHIMLSKDKVLSIASSSSAHRPLSCPSLSGFLSFPAVSRCMISRHLSDRTVYCKNTIDILGAR